MGERADDMRVLVGMGRCCVQSLNGEAASLHRLSLQQTQLCLLVKRSLRRCGTSQPEHAYQREAEALFQGAVKRT